MLTSLALIFLVGMGLGWLVSKLRLPRLLGMLLTGILLGPYVLDLLDDSILGISADLRQLALIIILTRAGLQAAELIRPCAMRRKKKRIYLILLKKDTEIKNERHHHFGDGAHFQQQ